MRIPRVWPDRDNWRGIGSQALGPKLSEYPLLQVEFGEGLFARDAARRLDKRILRYCVDCAPCRMVRLQLFGSPDRLEFLNEVRGAYYFAPLGANLLDGAGIHQ